MSLSGVERAVAVAVADLTREHGFPPSMREIATALGWSSPSSAGNYIRLLVAAGVLCAEPHRGRSVRLAPGIVVSRRGQVARIVWPEPAEIQLDPTGCPICRSGS